MPAMPLRPGLASLRRAPAFSLAVVFTLALGAAAPGAIATLVHGVLLAPLPYSVPQQLARVELQVDGRAIGLPPALPSPLRRHARSIDDLVLYPRRQHPWLDRGR